MRFNSIIIGALAGILALTGLSEASPEAQLLQDGTPVRVRVFDLPTDLNHDEERSKHSLLNASTSQAEKSRLEAGTTGFQPPLRRGLSNNNPHIMKIAAFVDHDDNMPDSLLDWNCGERTYDTDTFNHNGTDYNTGDGFFWLNMANDGMIVVAVADGEIIDKHDGEPDQNCAFDPTADANQVVIRHSNGTITIYAHMKSGSVTPRKIGDRVEQGDYLGVMGSSGLSSGPHLHLGVQDFANNILDPYAGSCNELNNDSLWEDQESYKEQKILGISTHSAYPEFPPCPQVEVPHFSDVFAPEDTAVFRVAVRDFDATDKIDLAIQDPDGQLAISTSFTTEMPGPFSGLEVAFEVSLDQAVEGKYSFEASYAGQTLKHEFHVGDGPGPAPVAQAANNAFTGLWYDPALDGEGFNIVTSDAGTIVYFYGSDDRGNRVWLISDLIPGEIKTGQAIEVLMYESSGGIFSTPVASARGLSIWGILKLTFSACDSGQSILTGEDGNKVSKITKLAGVSGSSCVAGDVPADAPWAGLWYDPSSDGEGYNLIVSPFGRILYFYGFKTNGLRIWLVSDPVTQTLDVGSTVEVTLYESTQGTFTVPVPSGAALIAWGTAKITVVDCSHITVVIDGTDGKKTSKTVRLAGIIGSSCAL